jgi:Zn finger protein HypA/HybF involved in hydrogenase expression
VADLGHGLPQLGEAFALRSAPVSCVCMDCSAFSASRNSRTLPCGSMMREASSGASA